MKRLWILLVVVLLFVVGLIFLATRCSTTISQKIPDRFTTFTFSPESFSLMRIWGVPGKLVDKLEPLKDTTIVGAENLHNLLRKILSPAEADEFEGLIRRCTQGAQTRTGDERSRQEAIKVAIGNERQQRFWMAFLDNVSAAITVILAAVVAVVGFLQYLSNRQKEATDRATNEFAALWEKLASDDANDVASAVTGLRKFLTAEHKRFHEQVADGLALVGRLEEKSPVVRETLRPVIELAFQKIPNVIRRISWQHLKLNNMSLKGEEGRPIDLSDVVTSQ